MTPVGKETTLSFPVQVHAILQLKMAVCSGILLTMWLLNVILALINQNSTNLSS